MEKFYNWWSGLRRFGLGTEAIKFKLQCNSLDLMIYGEDVISNHPNLNKINGDIRDINLLKKIIPGHDIVIHLAYLK